MNSSGHFAKLLASGDPSLVHVVDLTRRPGRDDLNDVTDVLATEIRTGLERWRQEYVRDGTAHDAKWPQEKFDPINPMRSIYNTLIRLCVKDTFILTDRHCRDLVHTIAAVGCGKMVLLDGHWAEQARKVQQILGLPPDFVSIYKPNQVDKFLGDLATLAASRGLHRPPI